MTERPSAAPDDVLRLCLSDAERARCVPVGVGWSRAHVLFLPPGASGGAGEYVKIDRCDSVNDLRVEHAVLSHLAGTLPVPRVRSFVRAGEYFALRMSALAGVDASDARLHGDLDAFVVALARAIKRLHDLPAQPHVRFDRRLEVTIAEAERRLRNGQVDVEDLDEERQGLSADALLAQLHARRPASEDLVPTHGDYCLPNVLFDPDSLALTGFIDLGRFGVADRHQDLALALRSLRHNFERDFTEQFVAAYGMPIDPAKLAYYQLLDEFF